MKLVRCDNCGKIVEAPLGEKPTQWFERQENFPYGRQWHACSRVCRDKLPGIPAPF